MNPDVEQILSRELREVADGLHVPALPPLPQEPPRTQRHWQPLLVAAAVVLIVAGAAAVVTMTGGRDAPDPAPPPTPSRTVGVLDTSRPTVPYLLDGRLYVDGERVPGTWWSVKRAGDAWVAHRDDGTWWWGTDSEPLDIEGSVVLEPQLSPDGSLLAFATSGNGGTVVLAETRPGGEAIGTLRIDDDELQGGGAFGVVAVTDDGAVILGNGTRQLLWRAPGDETVDLGTTARDQWVQGSTPAGLVVLDGGRDGEDDAIYLADVSDSGELTRLQTVPGENVVVNPSGTWLAHGGSWGGESGTIPSIRAQRIDGRQQMTLDPPDDRPMAASTWEDDDLLLAELGLDGSDPGLVRCSIKEQRCLLIETD